MAKGCGTGLSGYIGWRAGTASLRHWRFYPPVMVYDFGNCTERPERGGHYWLSKLRQMGSQGVNMIVFLPWLVRWAVVPVQEIFVLPWPCWPSTTYFSSPYTI
jgi:hypothetical protein